jgi:hypothetical protein
MFVLSSDFQKPERRRHKDPTFKIVSVVQYGSDGKTPLGRLRHKWKDNIKIYLREIG